MPFHNLVLELSDRKLWLIIVFIFLIIYTGCSTFIGPTEGEIDTSFITDQPCAPPCWHGIRLNESTKDDVYQILDQLPFILEGSVRERSGTWEEDDQAIFIDYRCPYAGNGECGDIVISDNQVRGIMFTVGYELTIEEVFQKLGRPDYVSYVPGSSHIVSCTFSLYWVNEEIQIWNYERKACPTSEEQRNGIGIQVERETRAHSISYGFQLGVQWLLINEGGPYLLWPGFAD
jgi:hypothetical protein